MPQVFIHYLPRKVRILSPAKPGTAWYVDLQKPVSGFERPQYHVTRAASGPAAKIRPGDTIWIISQLYSRWGVLPPAVDARMEVASVCTLRKGGEITGYRYNAAGRSRWFPLADATVEMQALKTVNSKGQINELWPAPHLPIGCYLQQPRKLMTGERLGRWEKQLDDRGFDFVSYRLRDGTPAAFKAVQALVSAGQCVWWDRWSLPRGLAERREHVADGHLQSYLVGQLSRAKKVWGIDSPYYDEPGSYSCLEKQHASQLGKFEPYFTLNCKGLGMVAPV